MQNIHVRILAESTSRQTRRHIHQLQIVFKSHQRALCAGFHPPPAPPHPVLQTPLCRTISSGAQTAPIRFRCAVYKKLWWHCPVRFRHVPLLHAPDLLEHRLVGIAKSGAEEIADAAPGPAPPSSTRATDGGVVSPEDVPVALVYLG